MIIVETESPMIAYLDNGMVYSSQVSGAVASVETEIVLKSFSTTYTPGALGGYADIYYAEYPEGQPGGLIPPPMRLEMIYARSGSLIATNRFVLPYKIKIVTIHLTSEDEGIDYSLNQEFVVNPGQSIVFNVKNEIPTFNNPNTMATESPHSTMQIPFLSSRSRLGKGLLKRPLPQRRPGITTTTSRTTSGRQEWCSMMPTRSWMPPCTTHMGKWKTWYGEMKA